MILDTSGRRLKDRNGRQAELRYKSMDVLLALASRIGETFPKQELIETVWAQDHVSEDNLAQCVADIRKVLGDTDKRIVETVPRVGYRLSAPDKVTGSTRRYVLAAGLAVFVLIATVVGYVSIQRPPHISKPFVVAVLPLDDLSDANHKGYLSDALSEGLITELARFPQFKVIARNSSFQFRGAPTDVRQIGEILGADYIIEGSQQIDGERLRVTVQLIDSSSGTHLLSEKLDRTIDDLFAMQDQIVSHVASRVGGSVLTHIPTKRTKQDVNSLLRSLQARQMMRVLTRENWQKALALEEISITEDPASPWGYIGKSLMLNVGAFHKWTDQPPNDALEEATELAQKALAISPENYMSHYALARVLTTRRDHAEALLHFQRAAQLNPSDSMVLIATSIPLLNIGEVDQAISALLEAKAVDPLHGDFLLWQLGWAYWQNNECDKGLEAMLSMASPHPDSQTMLAAIYSCLNRFEDAKEAMKVYLKKRPNRTLAVEAEFVGKQWTDTNTQDRWLNDMRLAGMPE